MAQVLIAPFGRVVVRIHHRHDPRAVDALPEADLERNLARSVERPVAPHQLLCREADQARVCGDRGKRPPEAEAVRKEDVRTLDAELRAVEVLSVEDVAREGLCRRDIRVRGVPRTPRDVPPTFADVALDQFVLVRVVLLHPLVLDTALEVEDIVRILRQQMQVLVQCLRNVLQNRPLHVPVPLGIEVRVRNQIGLVAILGDGRSAEDKKGQAQKEGVFFHLFLVLWFISGSYTIIVSRNRCPVRQWRGYRMTRES